MAKFNFVKSTVKSLKMEYGQTVTLYKTTTQGTIDWAEGTNSGRATTTKVIKKAVVLPGIGARHQGFFNQD